MNTKIVRLHQEQNFITCKYGDKNLIFEIQEQSQKDDMTFYQGYATQASSGIKIHAILVNDKGNPEIRIFDSYEVKPNQDMGEAYRANCKLLKCWNDYCVPLGYGPDGEPYVAIVNGLPCTQEEIESMSRTYD